MTSQPQSEQPIRAAVLCESSKSHSVHPIIAPVTSGNGAVGLAAEESMDTEPISQGNNQITSLRL